MDTNTSKKDRASAKKKLITVIVIIAVVILILSVATWILSALSKNKKYEEETIKYNFYPADFNENIYEDSEYSEMMSHGFIKFYDANTGTTVGINKDSAEIHGKTTVFMIDLIYDIIDGNHSSYNQRFSDNYYKNRDPKDDFTMQRLYDVTLTFISAEKSDKGNYTKYLYCLEYKIDQNNGTFRKDIGDGSKKQYFTITDSSGELKIDQVSTVKVSS